MKQNILHIGLDVDDTQYHGSALHHTTGEVLDFKCRPNLKGLLGQLDKLHPYFSGSTFKLRRSIGSVSIDFLDSQ